MKVAIKFSSTLVAEVHEVAPLLEALGKGALYTESGWGEQREFTLSADSPSIEFISEDALKPRPEPLAILQKGKDEAEIRWYEEYRKHEETKKLLKETQEKLSKFVQLTEESSQS